MTTDHVCCVKSDHTCVITTGHVCSGGEVESLDYDDVLSTGCIVLFTRENNNCVCL